MKEKRTKSQMKREDCFPEIKDKFTLAFLLNRRDWDSEIDEEFALAHFPLALQLKLHLTDPKVQSNLVQVYEAIFTYALAGQRSKLKSAASELDNRLAAYRKDLNERTANHLLNKIKEEFDGGDLLALHSAIMVCKEYDAPYPEWLTSYLAEASEKFLEEEDSSMFVGDRSKGGRQANPHVKKIEKEAAEKRNAALSIAKKEGLKGDKRIFKAMEMLGDIGEGRAFETVRREKVDQAKNYYIWKLLVELNCRLTLKLMDALDIPRPDSAGIKFS